MFLTDVSKLTKGSHELVQIECQLKLSDKCPGIRELMYKEALKIISKNNGVFKCLKCSRKEKKGENNPNCKYVYDRNIFNVIDSNEKAYVLGWIGSDSSIAKEAWSVVIKILESDKKCLKKIRDLICPQIPIKHSIYEGRNNMIEVSFHSDEMCNDVCKHLKIQRGKKDAVVEFPDFANEDLGWAFIRGYFEGDGTIRKLERGTPECSIASNSKDMLVSIGTFSKIPYYISGDSIIFSGTNCIDFLSKIYKNHNNYILDRKYELYLSWLNWRVAIREKGFKKKIPSCYCYKTDVNAIIPSKTNESDVGYDLTIIKQEKQINSNTILYDTGIKIKIDHGYYAEIVPRSSLIKSGYMLSNSIGIIDRGYVGNLFIALTKTNEKSPEITLPFKCCQLIIREQIHVDIIESTNLVDIYTTRGEGGFGSTEK